MSESLNKVICRKMIEEDLQTVMEWRMSPEITKFMYTDPKLTLEDQKKWFYRITKESDKYLGIIEVDGVPVGPMVISEIDYINKTCAPVFYIANKEKRSLELALRLEWSLFDFIFSKMNVNKFSSEVFSFNKGVIRLHQLCGCTVEKTLKNHIEKNGQLYDVTFLGITADEWKNKKAKFKYEPIEFQLK